MHLSENPQQSLLAKEGTAGCRIYGRMSFPMPTKSFSSRAALCAEGTLHSSGSTPSLCRFAWSATIWATAGSMCSAAADAVEGGSWPSLLDKKEATSSKAAVVAFPCCSGADARAVRQPGSACASAPLHKPEAYDPAAAQSTSLTQTGRSGFRHPNQGHPHLICCSADDRKLRGATFKRSRSPFFPPCNRRRRPYS